MMKTEGLNLSVFISKGFLQMSNCIFDYQILKLTSDFYHAYPNPPYVEILRKPNRAYNCLLVKAYDDIFMCIPYRTNISHKYAYHFKNSVRSRTNKSGLDYTKDDTVFPL